MKSCCGEHYRGRVAALQAGAQPPSLEEQYECLRQENAQIRLENIFLRHAVAKATNDEFEEAAKFAHGWLWAKVNRQRAQINRLQWRGWEPEFIIQEQEDLYDIARDSGPVRSMRTRVRSAQRGREVRVQMR